MLFAITGNVLGTLLWKAMKLTTSVPLNFIKPHIKTNDFFTTSNSSIDNFVSCYFNKKFWYCCNLCYNIIFFAWHYEYRTKDKSHTKIFRIFIFYFIHKVLDSRKFSTSGLRWIYILWDVLNTIWPFLENVCLNVCLQNFVDTVSQ